MSAYFTGVTFAEQKVSPSDDAIIRRLLLKDGVLTGCSMSYSGSTLTMAAGQLMICGRQINHPSAQNWAVVDATSGYARLLLTIDLTRTATKDAFDQVVESIEYASAIDGFPALEQMDINGSGTRYQIVMCVVSLGTGGITGIVEELKPTSGKIEPYPIGSIYLSVNETSPAVLFGGTWERLKDRFLLAAGDTYAAGATGGEATHKLTVDELPSHTFKLTTASGSNTGELNTNQLAIGKEGNTYNNSNAINSVGGNKAHNNMPPYLAVYMWKRTA
jgi:hypothetical protein